MIPRQRPPLSLEALTSGVLDRHIPTLARAITLVESTAPHHRALADDLLTRLLPHTGGAHRVGITGVPGVGKSTFIEALGLHLINQHLRVAVLAIDPSSARTGGSILGDKTRMPRLAAAPEAFIRPSPTRGTLGGVAAHTREALLLCEAAGFDVVIIETVGVGQSETVVADLTDSFLVLLLANAGDELQGIKRGLMEVADVLAINKADGPHADAATRAAATTTAALHLLTPPDAPWHPPVLTCSALEDRGIAEIWENLQRHRDTMQRMGLHTARRQDQQRRWLWRLVDERLHTALHQHPRVKALIEALEPQVLEGSLPPSAAADQLLGAFFEGASGGSRRRSNAEAVEE